jgi:hypothetical protein
MRHYYGGYDIPEPTRLKANKIEWAKEEWLAKY